MIEIVNDVKSINSASTNIGTSEKTNRESPRRQASRKNSYQRNPTGRDGCMFISVTVDSVLNELLINMSKKKRSR